MERDTTCCFTGHRPDKLPWGENENALPCLRVKKCLMEAVERAYGDGFRHFITGMARGGDFYFAEAVLQLREKHPEVTLEGAVPCESQADAWPERDKLRYASILDRCNYETLVQHRYDRGCMMRRNRYMVDHAARIIAIYDGMPKGGTAGTLAYALRQGLQTEIIEVEQET